jgi:acyl transferase domain-containing protein
VAASYNPDLTPKTAFLFPGQGSQFAGMGKHLADRYTVARSVFEEADDVLGFALSTICFEGPDDALRLTENTQPKTRSRLSWRSRPRPTACSRNTAPVRIMWRVTAWANILR